jgi:2-keto-4-pentenoate hydratase
MSIINYHFKVYSTLLLFSVFATSLFAQNKTQQFQSVFGNILDKETQQPIAEAEVVFKLKKEINSPIELHEVLDYVSHVSAGMEIYDSRFGDAEASFNDSVADNASAAAFSYSEWIPASADILDGLEAKVFVNDDLVEETLLTSIRGNPWMAVVALSTELAAMGIRLPAGSIVFSGSATQEILMRAGSTYKVEIKGLGTVVVTAS